MVSSASATQAASEAASAGWEAANAAAIADHDATADLFGMELATVEASIFSTATQLAHERERAFTLGEDLKAAQVRTLLRAAALLCARSCQRPQAAGLCIPAGGGPRRSRTRPRHPCLHRRMQPRWGSSSSL